MSTPRDAEQEIELSVVIVNYNGAGCLPATLGSLAANTTSDRVECLVVDSGSDDTSWRDVERHWAAARFQRHESNIGFCAGCNRGAEEARGRFVAFVNFDGQVEPGWDEPLRRLLDSDPSISVATGLLLRTEGDELEAAGLDIAPNMATFGRLEGEPRASAIEQDVAAASGALMMVRRGEFLALGGFWETIWMYGEEADLCLRVPGRVRVSPASAIRHEHGHAAGPKRSDLRLYWPSRNRIINASRHLPAPSLLLSVLLSAAFDAVTLLQVRRWSAVRAVLTGWRHGLALARARRRDRSASERCQAARRVTGLGEALAAQRRLTRPARP